LVRRGNTGTDGTVPWKDYEMRKGFTRKPQRDEPAALVKNYITPGGLQRLKDEHRFCSSGNARRWWRWWRGLPATAIAVKTPTISMGCRPFSSSFRLARLGCGPSPTSRKDREKWGTRKKREKWGTRRFCEPIPKSKTSDCLLSPSVRDSDVRFCARVLRRVEPDRR